MGIRDWFRTRPDDDREIREEITFHVDRATQENIARGMGEAEARAEALRRFGDLERVRKECVSARGRRVPAVLGWAAVSLLAVVSFLSGMAVQGRSSVAPGVGESGPLFVYSAYRSPSPHVLRYPVYARVTDTVPLEGLELGKFAGSRLQIRLIPKDRLGKRAWVDVGKKAQFLDLFPAAPEVKEELPGKEEKR